MILLNNMKATIASLQIVKRQRRRFKKGAWVFTKNDPIRFVEEKLTPRQRRAMKQLGESHPAINCRSILIPIPQKEAEYL